MSQDPTQKAINDLVQGLRPKPTVIRTDGRPAESTLDDEKVLEHLFGERDGQKWRDLYEGSWQQHYDSQSQADAALLHKFAFWTNRDREQMERIIRNSGLNREKWDGSRGPSTWLADEISRAIDNTTEGYKPKTDRRGGKLEGNNGPAATDEQDGDDGRAQRDAQRKEGNQAQRLIGYAQEAVDELFRDQNGTEHALVGGVPLPLDRGCYGWLRRLFWEHEDAAASTELLGTVAGQLRAFAEVSGNEHTLHLRAAQHEGAVYLYLGPGRVVRVDASGWRLDPNPPVMFRRVANLKQLPDPERGGSLDLLDAFITAREDRDHRLAKAWLVLALLAEINRPILLAHGPQGATKSSVQRVLKNIIDPAKPTTLKVREKDFEQNINKAFIPFFDNISTITNYMADELSKAVTGAGNAVRKLYEDDEDVIREYKRAMLLNGLIIPTEKADLIDRILPVGLKRVPEDERETERRMQALFDERHPRLLGAVLDALAGAIANHEEVRGLPRLADWAEYAIALYKHLDWGGYKGFMQDWAVIEEGQHETTLESSVLAQCVVAVMKEHDEVDDTPSEVLKLLKHAGDSEGFDTEAKGNDFPASATWLVRKLVPIVPTLESFSIKVEDGTRKRGGSKTRYVRFSRDNGGGDGKPPEGDSKTPEGDSKNKMLSPVFSHTYGLGTAGDSRTADLPENREYSTKRGTMGGDALQGGKNAVPAVPAVHHPSSEAYLSEKRGDSRFRDAVPPDSDAVPTPRVVKFEDLSKEDQRSLEAGELPGHVYVGRGKRGTRLKKSKWGNTYVVGKDGTRDEVCDRHERDFLAGKLDAEPEDLPEIRGKILVCHCSPERCHADHLLRLANATDTEDDNDEEVF